MMPTADMSDILHSEADLEKLFSSKRLWKILNRQVIDPYCTSWIQTENWRLMSCSMDICWHVANLVWGNVSSVLLGAQVIDHDPIVVCTEQRQPHYWQKTNPQFHLTLFKGNTAVRVTAVTAVTVTGNQTFPFASHSWLWEWIQILHFFFLPLSYCVQANAYLPLPQMSNHFACLFLWPWFYYITLCPALT